jgi:4-alpha-glucanotransferase
MMQIASMPNARRVSGILLPLFSLRSRTDVGIGDFGALDALFRWMEVARQRMLVLLPLLPTLPGDSSPYATRSAFGLNPLFINLEALPDFAESGGWQRFSDAVTKALDEARSAQRIRYDLVLGLKQRALRQAFDHFEERHWKTQTDRAGELLQFEDEQADWLFPFALFCAISDDQQNRGWWEWPEPFAHRNGAALQAERERLARQVRFHSWLQWIAELQWREVRRSARDHHVLLCGDEPFIVGQDSADAWAHPDILRRDARLGVPPDDFSSNGQDWGLPYFDFPAMQVDSFAWLRARATNTAKYYDLRRVDHAVGYFRQWIRNESHPTGRFVPLEERVQRAQGEQLFRLISQAAGIVAEDLGVIPDFVRQTLTELSIPGYRVLRWERDKLRYRNPRQFPSLSLVTTSTHDTSTLREWWETLSTEERSAVSGEYPELRDLTKVSDYSPAVHQALLAAAENASSDLCILPWQDAFGTRERINLPGSISQGNWSYRIDQPVEDLLLREDSRSVAALLARLSEGAGR